MTDALLQLSDHNIFIFLVQLSLLLSIARGLGYICQRFGQPSLLGEILTGVILGPTLLGHLAPSVHAFIFPRDPIQFAMIDTVAWIGILLMLLAAGMEVDVSVAWRQRREALKISILDVILPMAVAFGAAMLLPDRYVPQSQSRLLFAFFVATVMTISALPVTVKALHDLNILKSDLGLLVISALTVNDIIGWMIFTLVLGLASQSQLAVGPVLTTVTATVVFAAFCILLGRRWVAAGIAAVQKGHAGDAGLVLTFVCCVGLIAGALTHWVGIHALFGLFLAGIMAGDAPALSQRTRSVINQMVHAIFVPIFFATIALQINFLENLDPLLIFVFLVVGIAGRYAGAWVGARWTSLTKWDRVLVAIAHTPGGAMEMVMALVAFKMKLITAPVYVAIVFSALASSVLLGPWMAWSIRRRRQINVIDLFLRRAMRLNLAGPTRFDAISELCEAVGQQDDMPEAAAVTQAVQAREETAATSIGSGVAVPHARLPKLRGAVVVFGRSGGGIDWDSPDGLPVHLVFMILTPQQQDELQVQILGSLAAGLENPQVQQRLLAAKDESTAWAILREVFTRRQIPAKT
ncbi:MAG: cation:proton antiporter [Planctomycetaceae bacterium]|nr:cation:proton antiporter [Planctomycetaceae bacterium]